MRILLMRIFARLMRNQLLSKGAGEAGGVHFEVGVEGIQSGELVKIGTLLGRIGGGEFLAGRLEPAHVGDNRIGLLHLHAHPLSTFRV